MVNGRGIKVTVLPLKRLEDWRSLNITHGFYFAGRFVVSNRLQLSYGTREIVTKIRAIRMYRFWGGRRGIFFLKIFSFVRTRRSTAIMAVTREHDRYRRCPSS